MAEKENKVQKEDKLSLEELFESLESVVSRLEKEEVTLEESFQLYQKGMTLLRQCNETIDTVEKKVQILDEDGEAHEF
ncbi:MAG: exodeoxyribonuclease VII small subunit [Muricomes sp.]